MENDRFQQAHECRRIKYTLDASVVHISMNRIDRAWDGMNEPRMCGGTVSEWTRAHHPRSAALTETILIKF